MTRPEVIRRRLAEFEDQAMKTRTRLHRELEDFASRNAVADLAGDHAKIEAIGPWESKAFEVLSRGVDPGVAAIAFVQQFIANAHGNPERGLEP